LAHDPGTRVLIASGYTADGHGYDLLSAGAAGFISKPYQLGELAGKIEALLANGTHHRSLGGKHESEAENPF
jgi:DNA-binding NarL/FixJ family response regulator